MKILIKRLHKAFDLTVDLVHAMTIDDLKCKKNRPQEL